MYESVIFLFAVHPFDVGDVILHQDKDWCVLTISFTFTHCAPFGGGGARTGAGAPRPDPDRTRLLNPTETSAGGTYIGKAGAGWQRMRMHVFLLSGFGRRMKLPSLGDRMLSHPQVLRGGDRTAQHRRRALVGPHHLETIPPVAMQRGCR